ncbi:unnamed protein product [Sphagnum jensenii]|uniref:V-type proton ATPase subunit G n=1 Tax=Sphagnum jensenii TaxID=128206 RepID=A0ABP0VRF2_9BRYO
MKCNCSLLFLILLGVVLMYKVSDIAIMWFPSYFLFSQILQADRGGIQALLAAEQDAQHIVANARAAKTARLRQAKEEADREVAQYRAQRESEFRKKLAETSGDSGSNVKRLEAETNQKIQRLTAEANKIAPEVTALLMKYVTTVRN